MPSFVSNPVQVGKLLIGGGGPVVIQSMTNTLTLDTEATVAQCKRLFDCGCQMVRITAPGLPEARNLENIKNALLKSGYGNPLVADIHFLPEAALLAAEIVEKVRINPGNYCDRKKGKTEFSEAEQQAERARIAERIAPLLDVCKKHRTALRIGVNQGSLSERMIALYGNTPQALVESALEFIGICREQGFDQTVVSLKSSRVQTMYRSVKLLTERMMQTGLACPLHLGVTEAGDGEDARLISAIGIGSLLKEGIGDTIRVSLTEAPENEIPVARDILRAAKGEAGTEAAIHAAVALGSQLLENPKAELQATEPSLSQEENKKLTDDIYQAAGLRFHKTRFIACPSCGRTQYDIQSALAKVKARFPNHPNLTIAVMGCIVNGPGEMADADFGYIGCGGGKVNLYKAGELVKSRVPEENALQELEALILQFHHPRVGDA